MLQSEGHILDVSFQNYTIFRKGWHSAYVTDLTCTMTNLSRLCNPSEQSINHSVHFDSRVWTWDGAEEG